jgi:alpha-1,2-mannosyltransferase
MEIDENQPANKGAASRSAASLAEARRFYDALTSEPLGRTILLACLVVLAVGPLALVQYLLLGWSVLPSLKDFFFHFDFANSDSWMPMREALAYTRAHDPGSLYEEIFFTQNMKFQYAPTALLPMLGLQALGIDTTNAFLNNINRLFIVANAAGLGILFRLLMARIAGSATAASPAVIVGSIMVGVASFLFYPMMMAFWTGQIQIWIDAAFTFACIALLTNRKLTAGILIGLVCLLKPQFSVFALWALFRKEWRFMAGAAAVLVPCGLLSLAIFGLQAHLDYLRVLSFLSQRGEAMIANNSVNGILNNWLGTADPLVWDERGFPPYNTYVHLGGLIAALLLIGGSLLIRMERPGLNGLLGFQAAALAYTMAAPIAWEHHYGILPPVLVTLFGVFAAAHKSPVRKQRLIAFCGVFLLSAVCITSNKYAIATPLNWFHGYLFAAGIGVIVLLWLAARDAKVEAYS